MYYIVYVDKCICSTRRVHIWSAWSSYRCHRFS